MENQNDGELIKDHSKQTCGKGNDNRSQQQPTLHAQFLSVSNGMDDTQQKEDDGCHLMNMDTGQRNQNGHNKAEHQSNIEQLFHAATSAVGMVLIPKIK